MNVALVVVGAALCVIGLAMLGKSQSGGFNFRNIGINFGGKSNQSLRVGDITKNDKKPNWVGLAIAVIGFLTAVVGLFKH